MDLGGDGRGIVGGDDPFLSLTDQAVLAAMVSSRIEERERLLRASEFATWQGTLRDLAEQRRPLVIRVTGDRIHRGILYAVAEDHVAVRTVAGARVLIASDTVRLVRPEPGSTAPRATGDRDPEPGRTLVESLARAVEGRATEVVIALREGVDPLVGSVVGLGEDVVSLQLAGASRSTVYLPVSALAEVTLGS